MGKLRMKYTLEETKLWTDTCSVGVKITPQDAASVVIQFGYDIPTSQIAKAADLRELAGIFLEVAEVLEDGNKPFEEKERKLGAGLMQGLGLPTQTELRGSENKASKALEEPLKEELHTVRVKLKGVVENHTLHGVFSDLTGKQAEELRRALLVTNAALPWGMHLQTLD